MMLTADVCRLLNCFLFEKFYLHYALCDFDSILCHCTKLFIRQSIDREPVADPENFGGGDNKNFKHKTSKIRMCCSNVFCDQNQVVSKKKKVFIEIETNFSAEIGNSNVFSAQNQVV